MERVLCFGDSNTFGYDPRSFFGARYPADIRWTGLLQKRGWAVANCGQNGLCIPRETQLAAVADLLRRVPSDVVTVMLGSNDLLNGASAEEAGERMKALLCSMAENITDTAILLIAPPPMRFGDWVQTQRLIDESIRLGGQYRALAKKLGVAFADAGEWSVTLTFDGVHFSPEGHAAFAAGLAETLEQMDSTMQGASQ